ncbi:MAG: hypothetical protein KJ970_18505 [Candidatus Eisenbacteria bacterium]|uniref:Uncharacterized protein n=1 Tax=Eiseniibacteriota bacterium TaxID=2212470 RepID=A0A948RXM6_UNCEI|nr:hypothetical protein [Candidatus Eisenbacteria bacterium]MBU1948438.1 hypothetical protein [Candidatus Eisenbacteria bacterium]MBU2692915.1 hypothetical protein [Candidatus Eisenbacteria bacterium]
MKNSSRICLRILLLVMTWLALGSSRSLAGPNAGGVLLLHVAPEVEYTTQRKNWCHDIDLEGLHEINTRSKPDPYKAQLIYVLAAFDTSQTSEVQTVTFGLGDYGGEPSIYFDRWGSCQERITEISTPGWPNPNEGTAIFFVDGPLTGSLIPLYWFAAYVYTTTTLPLTPHPTPTIGGSFVNRPQEGVMDEVVDFGILGFGVDGKLPAPLPPSADQENGSPE